MRSSFALLLALLPLSSALAEERVTSQPAVDADPTGWACTVKTLLSGDDCAFESQSTSESPPPGLAEENARKAAALAKSVCQHVARVPGESRPDKPTLEICLKEFAEAASHCDQADEPLLDNQGRFASSARDCYRGLNEVSRRIATMAASSARCCRCLGKNGCASSAEQCIRNISRGAPESNAARCLDTVCSSVCPIGSEDPKQTLESDFPEETGARRNVSPRIKPLQAPSKRVHHL